MSETIHFAVCVRNAVTRRLSSFESLIKSPDPDATNDGMLRVIDESGDDYLSPASFFVLAPLPAAVEEAVQHAVAAAG